MKPLSEMTERAYFVGIGQRPGMFLGKTSFHMLTAFLTGHVWPVAWFSHARGGVIPQVLGLLGRRDVAQGRTFRR
ncbi:hypothetical protein [Streptomyces sp. NPDC002265]|uniref:hypothetical protein n=1 Tax=Streptomyces sp. NPDC002265 TaxID=3154415 RepID=UPI0033171970